LLQRCKKSPAPAGLFPFVLRHSLQSPNDDILRGAPTMPPYHQENGDTMARRLSSILALAALLGLALTLAPPMR